MANLLPPDAKRTVIIGYWLRVATVWLMLIGFGFIAIAILMLPTLVLVQSQLSAFSGAYDEARDKEEAFEVAQDTINEANELAKLLVDAPTTTPLTTVMAELDTISGEEVTISNFQFQKTDTEITTIIISGVANTRVTLSNFSNDIEAHALFEAAELPISNLAKDRDIAFNIEITPATP